MQPLQRLKNLYFDTLVDDVDTLENLKAKVGTDYPYALGDWMAVEKVQALRCSDADKEAILEGNAKRLLKL